MAVDKSFVVKNGLEVNSDLIVADASSKKVGIASTGPRSTLDVRGGIAATDINITGIATIANLQVADGDVDLTNLRVTGFSTLGGLSVDQLTVTGFTTFTDLSYDEISGRNLTLTGIATIPQLDGITVFTDLNGTNATVGVATITTANVTTANVTTLAGFPNFSSGATVSGVVTATSFSGDGSQLTGLGVGVRTTGSIVGYGFTMLNFVGSGNTFAVNGTTVDISIAGGGGGSASIGVGSTPGDAFTSGIITAGNLWYNTGLGRLFIYYQDDNSAQWVDAAPFNVGIITTLNEISFTAGSAAAPALTFDSDSDSGFFQAADNQPGVAAAGSQVARFNPAGLVVTGVVTATSFEGDGSSLTGIDATSLTDSGGNIKAQANPAGVVVTGVLTATSFEGDGSSLTGIDATSLKDSGGNVKAQANPNGVVITGVATATSFSGSGANLTNLPAGLGTALSSDKSTLLGNVYYQDVRFSIGSTVTIDVPSTAIVGYTPYAEIEITGDADLIVSDGDEFVVDVLGIGTTPFQSSNSTGGKVRSDQYSNASGTGAPTFNNGLNVSGIVTSTSGFISNSGLGTGIQITLSGSVVTFTAPGIGSTSFTLF